MHPGLPGHDDLVAIVRTQVVALTVHKVITTAETVPGASIAGCGSHRRADQLADTPYCGSVDTFATSAAHGASMAIAVVPSRSADATSRCPVSPFTSLPR